MVITELILYNDDTITEEEKKLFIGMIPRNMTDDDLYKVLSF